MRRGTWFFLVVGALAVALLTFVFLWPLRPWGESPRPRALEGAGADSVTFELEEVERSGQFGFATLDPVGDKTQVGLELSMPRAIPQPAHVHQGSCGDVGAQVHVLEPLVEENPRLAMSTTVVDAPLGELAGGGLVIDVHSATDEADVTACGAIPNE